MEINKLKIYFLQLLLILFAVGCGPVDYEIAAKVSKTRTVPEKHQYKYREKKSYTALLVLVRDKTLQLVSARECVYLFEESDIISEGIQFQESPYRGYHPFQVFPLEVRYIERYLIGCPRSNERLEIYIPLRGKKEKKIFLGFGQKQKYSFWHGGSDFLKKKEVTIKKDDPQYYRWGSLQHHRFYSINPNHP